MEIYPKAIEFYNMGLRIGKLKQDYPKYYAMLLDNLCASKMKMKNYNRVYSFLNEALSVSDSIDSKPLLASVKNNLGRFFLYKKDTVRALANIKEGLVISKRIKYNELTLESLKLLMENDNRRKNHYTNEYLRLTDSLQKVERETRDKFARIAYETDLVEQKNQILSKRITSTIVISSLVLLISFSIFITSRLKSKNKELRFIQEQQAANEKIYQLMLQLQFEKDQARNEERTRIAMELHDGIINRVFATRFNLVQLQTDQTEKKELLVKELEKTQIEIRKISHDLTQNSLFENKSFSEMVKNLVESQQTDNDTEFDLTIDKLIDWSSISSDKLIHIYRIIQEALQNSNKYSNAKKCYVMLLKKGDKTIIRIWDNGIGFTAEKTKKGIGLRNIKERSLGLNGELNISSSPEKGTTIEVVF